MAKSASTLDKISRKACRLGPHRSCGHLPARPIVCGGQSRGQNAATADTAPTCGDFGALVGSTTEHSLLRAAAGIAEESPPSAPLVVAAQTAPPAAPVEAVTSASGADVVQIRVASADLRTCSVQQQSPSPASAGVAHANDNPNTDSTEAQFELPLSTDAAGPLTAGLPGLQHQASEEATRALLQPTPDSLDAHHLNDSPEHLRLYRGGGGAIGEANDSASTHAECASSAGSSSRIPLLTAQTSVMTDTGFSLITSVSEAGGGSGGSDSAITAITELQPLMTPLPSAGPRDGALPLTNCKSERSPAPDEAAHHSAKEDLRSHLLPPAERPDAQAVDADRNNNQLA